MKKALFGLALGSLLIAGSTFAATATKNTSTPSTDSVQARLFEQVLNSIEQGSVDLNVNDLSISNDSATQKTDVEMKDLTLTGILQFGSDWTVNLISSSSPSTENDPMQKVYPKLQAGAANLDLAVNVKMTSQNATIDAHFYGGYDRKNKKWIPRPLVLKVSNQLNKSLLTIRIRSLTAEKKVNANNPKVQDIVGSCDSDKIVYDFISGQSKTLTVDCSFSGTMTDQGYKLNFKYASKP